MENTTAQKDPQEGMIGRLGDFAYFTETSELDDLADEMSKRFGVGKTKNRSGKCVSSEQRLAIVRKIREQENAYLSSWMEDGNVTAFASKYRINAKEMEDYLVYFGKEKILPFIMQSVSCSQKGDGSLQISTRFLDFIRRKSVKMEDILKVISGLKTVILTSFDDYGGDARGILKPIFDEVAMLLSKSYSDVLLKIVEEYKKAIDNSNVISKTNLHGIITSVNDEFCKSSGFTREELIGKPHNIIRHPDMEKEEFAELWSTIKQKKIWRGDIKNRRKDGTSFWMRSTIVPILDENDNIIEYIAVRTDITELKEALKNVDEYASALNESNLVLKLDSRGRIIYANETFLRMSGYDNEIIANTPYIVGLLGQEECTERGRLMIPELSCKEIADMKKPLQKGMIWKGVIKNRSKTGEFFWTNTNIVPIAGINEEIVEYVVVLSDVTGLETARQELNAALQYRKELDLKKDEFLNIASHELRTPMTSIRGYLSMILDGDAGEISDEVRAYLENVYKSSGRLIDLINDMLDMAKIESGKQSYARAKTDLIKLLRDVGAEMSGLFAKKKQRFDLRFEMEEYILRTDGDKLRQAVLNLLSNANKFTHEGGEITLGSEIDKDSILIYVSDNGIGVDSSQYGRIFEKFGQVKNPLTRETNGTGLGLPIAKSIIEQMGGSLEVESELHKGSKFTIRFPIIPNRQNHE